MPVRCDRVFLTELDHFEMMATDVSTRESMCILEPFTFLQLDNKTVTNYFQTFVSLLDEDGLWRAVEQLLENFRRRLPPPLDSRIKIITALFPPSFEV